MDVVPTTDNDDGGYDRALAAEESEKDDGGGEVCRICRSPEGPDDPLRNPCACRGSKYFFHEECLRLWLDRHGNKQCEVCTRSYSFAPVYPETCRDSPRGMSPRAVRAAAYVFPAAEESEKEDDGGGDLCRICRSSEGPDDHVEESVCVPRLQVPGMSPSLAMETSTACEVCTRSYSFAPVYSDKAPHRLTFPDSLRGMSPRAVRAAAFVFVILFNAFCFSLHPWAAIVKQSVSEKFAFLLAVFFYHGLIVYAMTMMAVLSVFAGDLLRNHREVCVENDGLGVVAAGGFWKYMGILCGWWHDHLTRLGFFHVLKAQPRNQQLNEFGAIRRFLCLLDDKAFAVLATSIYVSFFFVLLPFMMGRLVIALLLLSQRMVAATQLLSGDSLAHEPVVVGYWTMLSLVILIALCSLLRFYGSQKDTTEDINEDRFRTLRIGLMLVLAALSLFLISTISMAFLILVGWTFFHNDLYGFWIGCSLLQVIHIMIRGTDLLLNLVLLWIQKPLLFSISDKKRDYFPMTRGKTRTVEQEVTRKKNWRSKFLQLSNIRKALKREIEKTSPIAGISLYVCPDSKPCLLWETCPVEPTEKLLSKDWEDAGGPVRNQSDHDNCWTYVCDDLCSSQRFICLADERFRTLSARYLTFYTAPDQRDVQRKFGDRKGQHWCHGYPLLKGLEFIRDNGGIPEETREEVTRGYSCKKNPPPREPEPKYTFEGKVDLRSSDKIEDLYEWLLEQPVGADMVLFQPEYDSITSLREVYEGPKADSSRNAGLHSVLVLKIVKINGKWAALVKLSHGIERGCKGYMYISLSTMIVNAQFSSDGTSSEEEDENENKDEDGTSNKDEDENKDEDGTSNKDEDEDYDEEHPLLKPSYLLRHFTCPVIIRSG